MLEKTLESPLDCKEIHPVHPKEISPGCSLERLMLKLILQYFGHLPWRVDSLEKTLMLGRIGGGMRRGWQRMIWLDGITDLMDMDLDRRQELVMGVLWFMGSQRVAHNWATELNGLSYCLYYFALIFFLLTLFLVCEPDENRDFIFLGIFFSEDTFVNS